MPRRKQQSDPRGRSRHAENEFNANNQRALTKKERRAAARMGKTDDSEYDYIVDDTGITKASMKKAMKFVIVAFVFLLLSVGICFGSITFQQASVRNQRNACWSHQQEIQKLTNEYMVQNGFASLPAYVEDVPGFDQVDKKCPSGGEYTWDPVNGRYTCSVHHDVPDTFNQAETVMTSRVTTITNSNSSK